MAYKKYNLTEIELLLERSETSFEIITIPYVLSKGHDDDYYYYLFVKGYVSEMIDYLSVFNFDKKTQTSLYNEIQLNLLKSTNNALTLSEKNNINFFAVTNTNMEGEVFLDKNYPILALCFLQGTTENGAYEEIELTNIVLQFRESIAHKMKNKEYDFVYDGNLVYITDFELYDICAGGKHFYKHPDGTIYSRNVSDGILYDPKIIEIYRAHEGETPFKELNPKGYDAPFEVTCFSFLPDLRRDCLLKLYEDNSEPFITNP